MIRFQAPWRTLAGLCWNTERRGILMTGNRFSAHSARSQMLSPANYSTSVQAQKTVLEIQTLRPDRLISSRQSVLNLSGHRFHNFMFANNRCLKLSYSRRYLKGVAGGVFFPFPSDTKGVFYYHSAKSELRFRLCKEIDKFEHGQDLVLPNGNVWCRSLISMARDPRKYAVSLALIRAEFDIAPQDVDSTHDCHRVISTFSPQRLGSLNQPIMNISGLIKPLIYAGDSFNKPGQIPYTTTHSDLQPGIFKSIPFPPNTIGVLYYHQSQTSPTRLGELRFRLCSEVRTFDEGTDLCLPSGERWFVGSNSLNLAVNYRSIREHLVREGLLECDPYPGVPDSIRSLELTPLTSLGQPFVVDLSHRLFRLELVTLQPEMTSVKMRILSPIRSYSASLRSTPAFSGRAVVRLEEYPTSQMPTASLKPVFAMRILETLTPLKRLSADDGILDPMSGELLMRKSRHGRHRPWGYKPTKPDARKAIEDWIAQSNSQN